MQQLEQTNILFALIVDGCLRMDEFERMRSELVMSLGQGPGRLLLCRPEGGAGDGLSRLDAL
jgi:hypothetical protein